MPDDSTSTNPTAPPSGQQTNTELLLAKDRVQRYLADMDTAVQFLPTGELTVGYGSARVFVACRAWGEDATLVQLTAPVLQGADASHDLPALASQECRGLV
jgi:hypothetical protein